MFGANARDWTKLVIVCQNAVLNYLKVIILYLNLRIGIDTFLTVAITKSRTAP